MPVLNGLFDHLPYGQAAHSNAAKLIQRDPLAQGMGGRARHLFVWVTSVMPRQDSSQGRE
ncbi:hypothetical protein ABWI00_17450 [Algihabitans albus]|uniref:hypothetical protein n=1 Tax=Algihabitans albus TaxID=2164067 RepID=UPI0035D048FD